MTAQPIRRRRRSDVKSNAILILSVAAAVLLLITAAICLIRYVQEQTQKKLYPRHYQALVEENAAYYGIPEELIYAVIRSESSFDPDAESSAGARGLMQLMPTTFEWIAWRLGEEAHPERICEPGLNIRYGCYLLSYYYGKYESWTHALAAYNAGDGNVDKWLADPAYTENGILVSIPFPETRSYVKKVEDARAVYVKLYTEETD